MGVAMPTPTFSRWWPLWVALGLVGVPSSGLTLDRSCRFPTRRQVFRTDTDKTLVKYGEASGATNFWGFSNVFYRHLKVGGGGGNFGEYKKAF